MVPVWRVIWDHPRDDWIRVFRPTRQQCLDVFEWVLDLIEHGLSAGRPTRSGAVANLSYDVETARVDARYLLWLGEPKTIAIVEIISY